ncbi:30S ribosomal protein S8e [Candidatus Woesearchaeota archaeon]|nr:30S ribosomal protein S8e [Candidatus Woesearchaeota archaeon]
MVFTQTRSKRKVSGGRYIAARKKKLFESGKGPTLTRIAESKQKTEKTKAGKLKTRLLTADTANLVDPNTKKTVKAKIETVLKSSANRHFIRRNILVKGTIIQTDKGKARITSRPGQEGVINAVLITEK